MSIGNLKLKGTGTLFLMAFAMLSASLPVAAQSKHTVTDGDWALKRVQLENTPEAEIMVRVGDIDELGPSTWPKNYSPFSGGNTPEHRYFDWKIDPEDPPGTDRIVLVSSYRCRPPRGEDGYTGQAMLPHKRKSPLKCEIPEEHRVVPIVIEYNLKGRTIRDAMLQLFVDDFQAPVWGTAYEASLNGTRIPTLEAQINSLNQTGPVGKLISYPITENFLPLLSSGKVELKIDDSTTGAGDGYAISFVKLLINKRQLANLGAISGQVVDGSGQPVAQAEIRLNGQALTKTNANGFFDIPGVPAGLASLGIVVAGHQPQTVNIDVVSNAQPAKTVIRLERSR